LVRVASIQFILFDSVNRGDAELQCYTNRLVGKTRCLS
jgi:hypothetical protein